MEENLIHNIDLSKVYIKINDNNEIIEINSDEFIDNISNWIYIDEGNGDKYRLAQQHYLEKRLVNENGAYNYKYINNKIVENDTTKYDIIKEKEQQIMELKQKLNETDYKAIKYAEGVLVEDYEPIKQQRQEWRNKINELESELQNI